MDNKEEQRQAWRELLQSQGWSLYLQELELQKQKAFSNLLAQARTQQTIGGYWAGFADAMMFSMNLPDERIYELDKPEE